MYTQNQANYSPKNYHSNLTGVEIGALAFFGGIVAAKAIDQISRSGKSHHAEKGPAHHLESIVG